MRKRLFPFRQNAFEWYQLVSGFVSVKLPGAFGAFLSQLRRETSSKRGQQGQAWNTETTLNIFKAPLSSSSVKRSVLPNCGCISQRRKREADSRENCLEETVKFHRHFPTKRWNSIDCRFPLLGIKISPRLYYSFSLHFSVND